MDKKVKNNTSDEILAAFLDGNATAEESLGILDALADDAGLREILHISQMVDAELGLAAQECDFIPMTAMAASCDEGAYCSLECEKYVLKQFDIAFDEETMMVEAVRNGWLKESGTALHNVGRHLESRGLVVERHFNTSLKDLADALNSGEGVIVAVDGGELLGDPMTEINEDIIVGQIPDHTVVVLSVDEKHVTVFDPNSSNAADIYPLGKFEDAWNDSKNFLVTIRLKDVKEYDPKPIDLSDVQLPEALIELREAIAENAHDVWAVERKAQGWTYGQHRDDAKKQTPCMVPYSQLPDSEKQFDRDMAMNTLKLLCKLGYDIVKR